MSQPEHEDDLVFKPEMSWGDFCEWAKQHISHLYVSDNELCFWNVDCDVVFKKDGTVTVDCGGTLATNRTPAQMKAILENLL